jgi:hypothetical protein
MGGDYGIQRFVGNFGAIVFAPLGGFIIDATSSGDPSSVVVDKSTYSAVVYVYLALKLVASVMILMIQLDFKPPGERILSNIRAIAKNAEVVVFLVMMMFAGTFWGFIEAFLFWYLDDLGASHFLMGWTVAVGMVTRDRFYEYPIRPKAFRTNFYSQKLPYKHNIYTYMYIYI